MRALSSLLTQLVFQLMLVTLCIGGDIVIRQSRTKNQVTGEGTWQVIGIATVQLSGYYTFLCTTNDDGASLRWYAVGGFTTISQSSVRAGQLLTINETRDSDIGEYVCRDTVSGNEARLNLTRDNPAVRAAQSTVVVEAGQRANLVVYISTNRGRDTSTLRWYRGMERIMSNLFDGSTRLTFENVQLSDAGVYNITISLITTSSFVLSNEAFITLRVYVRPVLTTPLPTNLLVNEWSTVQLECRFTGDPIPQVTWHSSTGTIGGLVTSNVTENDEITSKLIFNSISVADGGQYECRGSNDFTGIVVTSNTIVSITPRMLFFNAGAIIDGSVLIVQLSHSLTLLCRSSGTPLWYTANGMSLVTTATDGQVYQVEVDSNTQALKIISYNDALSGVYSCINSNIGPLRLHRNITLTTDNPSVSTTNATSYHPRPGSSLQLMVHILGDPAPRVDQIMWYRNDTLITVHDQQLALSHDRTQLTIRNIGTQYYGVYQCNVTTSAGTRSQFFSIMRPFEPSATIEPPTHTVTIGDRTHFTCRVQQGTSPITILWRYENHNKLPSGVNNTHDDVLSFDNVQTKHNGTYSCIVSNSWGSVEISATLLVQAPPHVSINNSTSVNTTEFSSGDTAPMLICVATGNPLPEVRWTYRHGDNDDLPDGIISNSLGVTAMLTWSRPLNYTDAGLYQCEGTNVVGSHNVATYLTVTASPVITAIESNPPTTREGSSVSYVTPTGLSGVILSCTAFGVPLPDVQWVTAKGLALPDHVTSVMSSSGSHDLNHVTAQLEWERGFSGSDAGGYKCMATNSAGRISQNVTLAIAPRGNELFIQLRILSLSCSHWQASKQLTLDRVHAAVLSSLHLQCQCQLDDNNLISESLSCSEVVDGATLYRAKLVTVDSHTASDVSDILTSWVISDKPFITLNNTQHKIDKSCQVLVQSANQSECNEVSNVDNNDNDNKTLLYGLAGLVALVVICIILIVILALLMWRRRSNFSRTLCKSIRNTLYISNSFQAHLNQVGQSTITDQQIQTNDYNDGTSEAPHHYESINDFPNKSRRAVQPDQSPRLSSESHGTTDSGIHSRTHSCDRLTAQPSQSDVVSSHASAHPSLAYSRCEEISVSPLHDESPHAQTRMQYRQPSFDELRYMSGVKMTDNEKSPRLLSHHTEGHSQPLEMIDSPSHKYFFSEQRSSHSQSSKLSQSYPSVSHLQQQFKQPPEPYVEPVSFRSSLHSILGQSSQLDTMV